MLKEYILLLIFSVLFIFCGCNTTQKKINDNISNVTVDTYKNVELQVKLNYQQKLYSYLNMISIVSIAGAGICLVLFFINGSKAGIIGGVLCVTTFILSICAIFYLKLLALIGLILLLSTVGYLIYNFVIKKRTIKELIESVELGKEIASDREEYKAQMNILQSDTTKTIVKELK